jgi:hypothetical protein
MKTPPLAYLPATLGLVKSHDADVPDFNEVVEGKGGRELDENGSPIAFARGSRIARGNF